MKTFKQYLGEERPYKISGYEDHEAKPGAEEAVEALNSIVGAIGEMDVMNPKLAVKRVKEDIARLGYQCEYVDIDPNGQTIIPLRGTDIFNVHYNDSAEGTFESTDSATEAIPGGISLMILSTPTGTGKYSVTAEVVRNSELEMEDDMA